MTTSTRRWAAGILAAIATYVGAWALAAPTDWWVSFPGAGRHWLPMLGPYNEHLARDVGALYLALAVLTIGAAVRPADGYLARLTGLAWLVFGVPHMIYHLVHLEHFSTLDKVGNVVGLGLSVVLGALLMIPARAPVSTTVTR
jgi:hypothetical protein